MAQEFFNRKGREVRKGFGLAQEQLTENLGALGVLGGEVFYSNASNRLES